MLDEDNIFLMGLLAVLKKFDFQTNFETYADISFHKAFESADKNHDGFLSPDEYVRVFR